MFLLTGNRQVLNSDKPCFQTNISRSCISFVRSSLCYCCLLRSFSNPKIIFPKNCNGGWGGGGGVIFDPKPIWSIFKKHPIWNMQTSLTHLTQYHTILYNSWMWLGIQFVEASQASICLDLAERDLPSSSHVATAVLEHFGAGN